MECRVIQKQIDGMRAQYEAQPRNNNTNKRQKTTYSQPKQDGDLHVLLDTMNDVKTRLDKEIKQRQMTCGKRKAITLTDDVVIGKEEKSDARNITENFSSELEELTLSDVSDGDLDTLSDLSEFE
jgi:hypothetical protein